MSESRHIYCRAKFRKKRKNVQVLIVRGILRTCIITKIDTQHAAMAIIVLTGQIVTSRGT